MKNGCVCGSIALGQSFQEFEAGWRAQGFDEALERERPPLTVLDTHVHPFAVRALVVRGEMWVSVGDETQHLRAGGTLALDPAVPHSERYGSEGASLWVARAPSVGLASPQI